MTSNALWQAIENSSFSSAIASSEWMFPTIETLHVGAIVTVIGAIAMMDMRLLGLNSNRTVRAVAHETLPVTWIAFGLAVVTGLLLFVSKATSYMVNPYFLWKFGFMALAGLNMVAFHRHVSKGMDDWGAPGQAIPLNVKLAGALSLCLWAVIPFCGRVIGFTLGVYYTA